MQRAILIVLLFLMAGCSVKKYAIRQLGNALSGIGDTFAADDDPELIRGAVPFSLKLVETLLNGDPRNEQLLLAASKGFTQYSYAFVQEDADEMEDRDRAAAAVMRQRAAASSNLADEIQVSNWMSRRRSNLSATWLA